MIFPADECGILQKGPAVVYAPGFGAPIAEIASQASLLLVHRQSAGAIGRVPQPMKCTRYQVYCTLSQLRDVLKRLFTAKIEIQESTRGRGARRKVR